MTHVSAADPVSSPQVGKLPVPLRRAVFFLLAAMIYLGPVPGQLFDAHSPWLREWVMYSGVGIGIPDGRFIVRHEDGSETAYTPLEAADLEQYPLILHYLFENRILHTREFARYAAPLCASVPENSVVRFEGAVGTRQGWLRGEIDNICAAGEGEQ